MKFSIAFLFLFSATLFVVASPTSKDDDVKWSNFKLKHKKNYSNKEEALRKINFLKVDKEINLHNGKPDSTYTKAHNHMSDWSDDDKKKLLGVSNIKVSYDSRTFSRAEKIEMPLGKVAPASLDYSKGPCVGPVKNQGCGDCWAFSAIAPLEYNYCMSNNRTYVSLSEQQIVDCCGSACGWGCSSGWPFLAWDYIQWVGGSQSTDTYPYRGNEGTCAFSESKAIARVSSQSQVASDVNSIVNALNLYGPLSVGFYVTNNFYSYSSGVFRDPSCTCTDDINKWISPTCPISHAVTNVGYGYDVKSKMDYWIIRNSWGSGWGNQGYFWVQKGVKMCGIENYVYRVSSPAPITTTTQKTTTQKPTTQKPTTQKPTTPKPTTPKPTTKKPTTQKPTTPKPTTQKPTTPKPTTQKPTTRKTTIKSTFTFTEKPF